MNITFMIGNGFDLNLNLKTGYKDFYKYYIERTKYDIDDIISSSIEKNYDLWADLELGLGLLLKDIDETQIDSFLDSKAKLESILTDYLTQENNKLIITDENKFAEEFTNKVVNFSDGFCTVDKNQLKFILSKTNEPIDYRFITFNYTTILDEMIELVKIKNEKFSTHVASSTRHTDILWSPHHIHGTLDGEDLILCVDNPSQIDNEALQNDRRITDYMIKTNVNKALGERKIEIAKEIIDNSRYICLFGLSIGDTDSTWWKYLVEWLNRSDANRLVLFVKDDSKVQRSGAENVRIRDKNRAFFGSRSYCTDAELYDKIRDKIIIVRNSKIFTYKNIAVEDENNG